MLFSNDLLNYASTLDKLGDAMIEASSSLNIETPKNFEELRDVWIKQKEALERFNQIRKVIGLINPPPYLKDEHNELILAYDDFVIGTEHIMNSLKIKDCPPTDHTSSFNEKLYLDGNYNQKFAVQKTQAAIVKLAIKIEDSLK